MAKIVEIVSLATVPSPRGRGMAFVSLATRARPRAPR